MKKHLTISGILLNFAGKVTNFNIRECGYEVMLKSDTMVELRLIDYETNKNIIMQFTENTCTLFEDKNRTDLTKQWVSYFAKYLAKDTEVNVSL
ncbi:MAG: hypothetical protein IKM43_02665 [Clostridia bacterium]|nr:hypothetical protein [Clostridia bacterium]